MTEPNPAAVEHYYNARVAEKLHDFTHPLPRIEAAIETLAAWAPASPKRILEIGCGIGATSWRMARAWPGAEVIATDISSGSLEVARICFQRPNLTYQMFSTSDGSLTGAFDLIVMMDVYEHIAPGDRAALHQAIRSLLAAESRFILMIPTPEHQQYLRDEVPGGLQPVDEDIDLPQISELAEATDTKLLFYRKLGIWNYGDYFHMVLGRYQNLAPVAVREWQPEGWQAVKHAVKRRFGPAPESAGLRDYLGADLLAEGGADPRAKFQVSLAERRRVAANWLRRGHGA